MYGTLFLCKRYKIFWLTVLYKYDIGNSVILFDNQGITMSDM